MRNALAAPVRLLRRVLRLLVLAAAVLAILVVLDALLLPGEDHQRS